MNKPNLILIVNPDLNHDEWTKYMLKQSHKTLNKHIGYLKLVKSGEWIDEAFAKELDKKVA